MSKARDLANAGTALTTVSATELGYLDGVTSAVQTQINSKIGQSTAINPTIVDAKGDIIAASASDTVARLAVGANGTVLTAASGEATGLQWATPAAGGMTLLDSGSMSGASVTTATLSTSYKDLYVVIRNFLPATFDAHLRLRFNSDTNTRYSFGLYGAYNNQPFNENFMRISQGIINTANQGLTIFKVPDYANTTTWKTTELTTSIVSDPTSGNYGSYNSMNGAYNQTAAITTMTFFPSSGNITSGNYYVYGVK